jgi:hypothetical protein
MPRAEAPDITPEESKMTITTLPQRIYSRIPSLERWPWARIRGHVRVAYVRHMFATARAAWPRFSRSTLHGFALVANRCACDPPLGKRRAFAVIDGHDPDPAELEGEDAAQRRQALEHRAAELRRRSGPPHVSTPYRGEERINAARRWAWALAVDCNMGEGFAHECLVTLNAWGWWSPGLTLPEIDGVIAHVRIARRA